MTNDYKSLLSGSSTASIGSGFDENFDGGELGSPSAVALDDNSFFVTWVSNVHHNYGSVLGQKIDKSGNAVGEIMSSPIWPVIPVKRLCINNLISLS